MNIELSKRQKKYLMKLFCSPILKGKHDALYLLDLYIGEIPFNCLNSTKYVLLKYANYKMYESMVTKLNLVSE